MTTSTTSGRSVRLVMRSLLRRTGTWFRSGTEARQDCDETRQARPTPGGQAPDQASSSNRAGAGDHERTSRTKAQKPVIPWVTPAVTNPQTQHHQAANAILTVIPLEAQRRGASASGV